MNKNEISENPIIETFEFSPWKCKHTFILSEWKFDIYFSLKIKWDKNNLSPEWQEKKCSYFFLCESLKPHQAQMLTILLFNVENLHRYFSKVRTTFILSIVNCWAIRMWFSANHFLCKLNTNQMKNQKKTSERKRNIKNQWTRHENNTHKQKREAQRRIRAVNKKWQTFKSNSNTMKKKNRPNQNV